MQTSASMVMGIVFAPLGLVLVFTAAITPQWREGQKHLSLARPGSLPGAGLKGHGSGVKSGATEAILHRSDGLWETCLQVVQSELKQCWPVSGAYQDDPRVRLAQGLVLSSLFFCGTGIVLASIGVRCWADLPLRGVAAAGGLLIMLAGLLGLTALGVYTQNLGRLGMETPGQGRNNTKLPKLILRPAGSLYFGWLGACMQVLGGSVLVWSFKQPSCPVLPSCPMCPLCPNNIGEEETEVYEISC
ncbi:claudin-23 [Aplochiton taeniatus]